MGLVMRGVVRQGKLKTATTTEAEKLTLENVKQFIKDNEGQEIYLEVHSSEDFNQSKGFVNYFRKIIVPLIFAKAKGEYSLSSEAECEAMMSEMFYRVAKKKADGTEYKVSIPIERMTQSEQATFMGKVATWAVTKFQLTFPSANELNK